MKGLKLDKDGGTWLQTSLPASRESGIQRKAELKLSDTGELEGKLTVTYTGLEASQRRIEKRLVDEAERKKFLEDEVRESIPVACEVELTNQPDWKSSFFNSDCRIYAESYGLGFGGGTASAVASRSVCRTREAPLRSCAARASRLLRVSLPAF